MPTINEQTAVLTVGGTCTTVEESLSRIPVGVSTIIVTFNMPYLY